MGCGISNNNNSNLNQKKNNQPRTPVLLFYLPGPIKESIFNLLYGEDLTSNNQISIRFIDVPNNYNVRRFWYKEISTRRDFASSLYFADLRDHSILLLNIRTLNWLIRNTFKKFTIHVIALYENESQLNEFKINLDDCVKFIALKLGNNDSLNEFINLLKNIEIFYNETKKSQTTNI